MSIPFPNLPYAITSLEPLISGRTLDFHYNNHHKGYVTKLNELIIATRFEDMALEEIVTESAEEDISIFNNASQAWNHTFYWNCMSPRPTEVSDRTQKAIVENFGSIEKLQTEFLISAKKLFGSGWTWIVQNSDRSLEILNTQNADSPLTIGLKPILTCDVWEHAYYLDVQNERADYLNNFWQLIDWEFVDTNLSHPIRERGTLQTSQNVIGI